MYDTQRREFLASLGLNPDAPGLADAPPAMAAEVTPATPTTPTVSATPASRGVVLAPAGVDPHTMPVSDIVFDPRLLDGFPDLDGVGMAEASRHIFAAYRSPGRNRERNSHLHVRIGQFIAQVRRSRATGGHVRVAVNAGRAQRDLAALLAAKGLTAADLVALLETAQTNPEVQ